MVDIMDMSNTFVEHSIVINNLVTIFNSQLEDSLCMAFGDNAKYRWEENDNEAVIPDVSINCSVRDRRNTFFKSVPRLIVVVGYYEEGWSGVQYEHK